MENDKIPPTRPHFQKKKSKKYRHSSKNNLKSNVLLLSKEIKEKEDEKQFLSDVKRKSSKCNSIHDIELNDSDKKINIEVTNNKETTSPPKENEQKKENIEEYVNKLYDDTHHRKSVFKKKPSKKFNVKSFNRRVSFQNLQKKKDRNINTIKLNEGANNKSSGKSDNNIENDDDEALNVRSRKSNASLYLRKTKNNDSLLKTSIVHNNDIQNITHKTVNKTFKKFNTQKIRSLNKKYTTKTNTVPFQGHIKKKSTSKSIEKRNKKKLSKVLKDQDNKDNSKDNEDSDVKNTNINNNEKGKKKGKEKEKEKEEEKKKLRKH